jgi:hypothetical protein
MHPTVNPSLLSHRTRHLAFTFTRSSTHLSFPKIIFAIGTLASLLLQCAHASASSSAPSPAYEALDDAAATIGNSSVPIVASSSGAEAGTSGGLPALLDIAALELEQSSTPMAASFGDKMEVEKAEEKMASMDHSEQHYFKR